MYLRTSPLAIFVAILLATSTGRVDVAAFAAYGALVWLAAGTIYTLALRRHPGLVAERMKPPNDRDRGSRLVSVPLVVAHYVVAGLDARFGWSAVPLAAQIAGFALVALGLALVGWTLLSNPYASSAVRIQHDREHRVITGGPYAVVRHPMYLGVLLFVPGSALALGSWWASLPLVPLLLVFVRRTLFEDRMLHAELAGYREYADRVRWRVVPGVF